MAEIANIGNYSPEDVVMIIANDKFSHTVSGIVEGTFISFERTVPRSTLTVGADLHAARVLRRNKSGIVTLTLMQSSETNDILSELARLDEEAHNNDWLFNVTIKDTLGRSVFFAPQAFLGNDPMTEYGVELSNREWTLNVINVQRHTGGNSKLSPDNQATLESFGYTVDDQWKNN